MSELALNINTRPQSLVHSQNLTSLLFIAINERKNHHHHYNRHLFRMTLSICGDRRIKVDKSTSISSLSCLINKGLRPILSSFVHDITADKHWQARLKKGCTPLTAMHSLTRCWTSSVKDTQHTSDVLAILLPEFLCRAFSMPLKSWSWSSTSLLGERGILRTYCVMSQWRSVLFQFPRNNLSFD